MSDGERFRFFYKGKAYLIPKDYIDDEHPGGGDEIWPWVNKDMTDAFDDADHSLDALEMLEEYLDEDYDPNEEQEKDAPREKEEEEKAKEKEEKKAEASAPPLPPPSAAAAATPVSAPASAAPAKQDAAKIFVAVKPEGETKSLLPVMASAAAAVVVLASVAVVMTRVLKKH